MDFSTAAAQSGALKLKTSIKDSDRFSFDGGLNLMDSPMLVAPGQLLGSLNYEPGVRGGYRRFDGYERFDGHASPTDSNYVSIKVGSAFTPAVGDTITESGSGASGVLCYLDTINHFVVITSIVGTFVGKGSMLTSGVGVTITLSAAFFNGGETDALANEYYLQKFLYLQAFIGPVGGADASGPVLGAYPYLDKVYAFRANAAGDATDMWVDSPTGWTKVALGIKVYYDAGIYSDAMEQPFEGTVLTGATSGATMTIKRVATTSGTWGTDAAGYFIVASITGTPTAGEHLQVAGVTYMDYLEHFEQAIATGGIYKFRTYNFNATENPDTGFRLYGVNGVDSGFEYDKFTNTFVLIDTGMDIDTPTHLEIHADYLFYAFPGGSLQNSGYQLPLNWNPVFGADARSVGEDVTFLREDVSQTLIIGTRRRVWMLTGIALEQFQIKIYAANTGAVDRTDEMPGQIMFMEDRGFTTFKASQQYGNFQASSLSDKILDIVNALMASDTAIGAVVTRKKNLYRIIFSSGTVLCLGINAQGKFGGWTEGAYPDLPHAFYGGFSQAVDAGRQVERAFLCGENGYLYDMDKGRSFDGKNVQHFLRLSYYDSKSPDRFKRYRRMLVDLAPEGTCTILMSVDYDYGNRSGQVNQPLDFTGNGGFWDVANWDQFVWDAAQYTQAIMKVEGEGYNIGLFFAGTGNNDSPATLYSASLQWSARVINRNTKEN